MTTGVLSEPTHKTKEKAAPSTEDPKYCFHLKGNLLPFTVLELYYYNYTVFNQRLSSLVKQAPSFFRDTPLIISLEKLDASHAPIDFIELTEICRAYAIFPIAIKGATEQQQINALVAGLPCIPAHNPTSKLVKIESEANADSKAQENEINVGGPSALTPPQTGDAAKPGFQTSKTITKPIRSGQQIYAANSDLIVIGSVSEGAEILADGNIHVYGILRGRALAGIKGYTDARIFCYCMEAELLSIAGRYKLHEDLKSSYWKAPVYANLVGSQLRIHKLDSTNATHP